MPNVRVEITRCVEDACFPSVVEFVLHDAAGTQWYFQEKSPIVWAGDYLDSTSQYPIPASAGCEVCRVFAGGSGRVEIELKWHVTSINGDSARFVVLESQLVEEHGNQIAQHPEPRA